MIHTTKKYKRLIKIIIILPIFSILHITCKNEIQSNITDTNITERKYQQLFESLDSNLTNIHFQNQILENGEYNFFNFDYIYNGGGVGVGDINNDGNPDLYLVSTTGPNKMYLNLGNFKFEDITLKSGLSELEGIKTGVSMVDINNDGYLDIYQCRSGRDPLKRSNHLYINNKNLTFTEKSVEYGLVDNCPSSSACFFDFDLDGDLDMYLLNHPITFKSSSDINVLPDKNGVLTRVNMPTDIYESDRLYINNGNMTFTDISKKAGIENRSYGLSVSVNDFNYDSYPDLYIGNDFNEPDIVYINNKNGTFSDGINDYFRHTCMHTMGVDICDINNDGFNDLFALDMNAEDNYRRKILINTMTIDKQTMLQKYGYGRQFMRNCLQLNSGNKKIPFSDIGFLTGMSNTDWSWCCLIQDFDNDGKNDVFIDNGFPRDVNNLDYVNFTLDSIIKTNGKSINIKPEQIETYLNKMTKTKLSNYIYKNIGGLKFENVTKDWGLDKPTISFGSVYTDLDRDGDMDLVINNHNEGLGVFKNLSTNINNKNKFIQFEFNGSPKNRYGLGTTVRFQIGNDIYVKSLYTNRGYASSIEQILHFGVGNIEEINNVEIVWPDGKRQIIPKVKTNQRLKVNYNDAKKSISHIAENKPLYFNEINDSGLNNLYIDNEFSDFDREFLIPHKLSSLGPCIAIGDVNGDKLEDLYIGGSNGNIGSLYLQNNKNKFIISPQDGFKDDAMFEDVSALFFDADNDKDLDLLIVSGGNEYYNGAPNYNSRVYFNDGKGNFKLNLNSLLKVANCGGSGAVNDYDNDGDLDIFIGCRSNTGKYPTAPNSYIFRNDDGKFVDVTNQISSDFSKIGMVSDIKFADLDGDKINELILVGEWMPITILKFKNGHYNNVTHDYNLGNSTGWWNCLQIADLDNDGDLDILGGNEGLNTRLKVNEKEPLEIFAKDFDNNGAIDPIITYYNMGKSWPLAQKDLITKQIPSLKKKALYYRDYAKMSINELFSKNDLESCIHLTAKVFNTSWFENNNGSFIKHELPIEAQFSPINGIEIIDLNNDNFKDVVLIGNKWESEPETGQQDAGNGIVLINNKNKNFIPIHSNKSGLIAFQNSKCIGKIKTPLNNILVIGNNNNLVQTFVIK